MPSSELQGDAHRSKEEEHVMPRGQAALRGIDMREDSGTPHPNH